MHMLISIYLSKDPDDLVSKGLLTVYYHPVHNGILDLADKGIYYVKLSACHNMDE